MNFRQSVDEILKLKKRMSPVEKNANKKNWTITVDYVGQTVFSLPFTYIEGDIVDLFLDGSYKRKNVDYSISGSTLTWLTGITLDIDNHISTSG